MELQRYPHKNTKIGGVVIFNRETLKVLVLKKHDGNWDLPKGHLERDENFLEGALRECGEETGLHPNYGNLDIFPYTYISLPSKKWLCFFLAFTNEIRVVVQPEEHAGYRWMGLNKAIKAFGPDNQFSQILMSMGVLSKTYTL